MFNVWKYIKIKLMIYTSGMLYMRLFWEKGGFEVWDPWYLVPYSTWVINERQTLTDQVFYWIKV